MKCRFFLFTFIGVLLVYTLFLFTNCSSKNGNCNHEKIDFKPIGTKEEPVELNEEDDNFQKEGNITIVGKDSTVAMPGYYLIHGKIREVFDQNYNGQIDDKEMPSKDEPTGDLDLYLIVTGKEGKLSVKLKFNLIEGELNDFDIFGYSLISDDDECNYYVNFDDQVLKSANRFDKVCYSQIEGASQKSQEEEETIEESTGESSELSENSEEEESIEGTEELYEECMKKNSEEVVTDLQLKKFTPYILIVQGFSTEKKAEFFVGNYQLYIEVR